MRTGAEFAFWKSQRWGRWERATAGSVCCTSRGRLDTVVVGSFDRFHFRGKKGAEERIWISGREGGAHTGTGIWTTPTEIPFLRPEEDLRRTLPSSYVGGSLSSNAVDVLVSRPQRSISLNLYRMPHGFCMRKVYSVEVGWSQRRRLRPVQAYKTFPSLRRIALLYKIAGALR